MIPWNRIVCSLFLAATPISRLLLAVRSANGRGQGPELERASLCCYGIILCFGQCRAKKKAGVWQRLLLEFFDSSFG